MIHRLKYHRDLAQGAVLASLLAERVQQVAAPLPQALIPVPLHWHRLMVRGFNQAQELAQPLGRQLGIPVRSRLVTRTRATRSQVGLTRALRRRNLRAAFTVAPTPLPSHVALIDDVITSGSTVEALAASLRQAGVARVDVWAVSRARLAK